MATAAPAGRAGSRTPGEPVLLLVSEDQRLRDDIALIAAVVGARLELRRRWSQVEASVAETAAAVLCSARSAPRTSELAQQCLLVGHDTEAVWAAAAASPDLRPVPLPAAEKWLTEHLFAKVLDRAQGRVIAVAGAAGGLGATTFAYLCAAELAVRSQSPLLIDATSTPGSGIADLVRCARSRGTLTGGTLDWDELNGIEGELSSAQLQGAVPSLDGIGVLTGPPASRRAMLRLGAAVIAGRRAYDAVFIDIGQQTEVMAGMGDQLDELVVVTRASRRGVDAARELVDSVPPRRPHLVINGRAEPGWGVAEVEDALGLPVAADLVAQTWLARRDDISESYGLLRSRRGAQLIGGLLQAVGVGDA